MKPSREIRFGSDGELTYIMVISSATVRAKHDDSQSIELKLKGRGIPLKKQLAVSGQKTVTNHHTSQIEN